MMSAHAIVNSFLKSFGSYLLDESMKTCLEVKETVNLRPLTADVISVIIRPTLLSPVNTGCCHNNKNVDTTYYHL